MDGMMMRHSQKLPVKLIQMRLVINPGIQKTYPTEHNLGILHVTNKSYGGTGLRHETS